MQTSLGRSLSCHVTVMLCEIFPKRYVDLDLARSDRGSSGPRRGAHVPRALREAGITVRPTMELDHTETIKRAVLAGLGIAFISRYAIEDEVRARRLRVVAVEQLKIRRHFHVIHDERRPLSASAHAFVDFLEKGDEA